jgi:serine/threonine protein phosphatase 1
MLIAVGDVHGHLDHLDALLDLLRPEILRARLQDLSCELVMLGDYVDRGPDSLGTLRRLIGLEALLGVPVHMLCGNHDQYLIDFLLAERPDGEALAAWSDNGGQSTLSELGIRRAEVGNRDPAELAARGRARAGADVIRLLRRLTYTRPDASYVCVHGGIRPGLAVDQNARHDLITLREPFLAGKGWQHGFTAIHGHTIRGPEVLAHRIAVDSGTYRTGVLSAVQIEGDRLRFLSVASDPKLKAFRRLPGLDQKRRFAPPEPVASSHSGRLAVSA